MPQSIGPTGGFPRSRLLRSTVGTLVAGTLTFAALAGFTQDSPDQTTAPPEAPTAPASAPSVPLMRIDEVLKALPPEVVRFNEHLTVLASQWMDGRLPGTPGMERAMDYMEHWFRRAGLEPAAQPSNSERPWRQPFPLGATQHFRDQSLAASADGTTLEFVLGSEFEMTGLGGAGDITAPLAFVGYAIDAGKDGYASFPEGDASNDLTGKVALMLRFEPMDDAGRSRWGGGDGWSPSAGFAGKFASLRKRNPAAVLVVNTPGADDPRIKNLKLGGQRMAGDIPVFSIAAEAADRLVRAADAQGRSLMELRQIADARGGVIDLPKATVSMRGRIEETRVLAENVVGLLPGRGALKDEIIVMGGHLDHLGMGDFGSRSGAGSLHPGADDNASGSAGLLLLAELLAKDYAAAPADQPLRSILFIAFSAEESGLNGSNFYVREPLFPVGRHVLMFNYDMIGRMRGDRLSVSGTGTGTGMQEWAKPLFEKAKAEHGLTVVESPGIGGGGSDHLPFYTAGIPVLFAIIADFHDDYHTPRDVGELINRESAMKAVWLFRDMALDAAKRPERFAFASSGGPMRPQPLRVRLGVRSRALPDEPGLEVLEVTPGGSGEAAGVKVGDRLLKWNKQPLNSREELVAQLRNHAPGDEIQAVVERDGEELTLFVTLKAPQ